MYACVYAWISVCLSVCNTEHNNDIRHNTSQNTQPIQLPKAVVPKLFRLAAPLLNPDFPKATMQCQLLRSALCEMANDFLQGLLGKINCNVTLLLRRVSVTLLLRRVSVKLNENELTLQIALGSTYLLDG